MKILKPGAFFIMSAALTFLGAGDGLATMYAYIPNTNTDSIAVVDMDGPTITAEVLVGNAPQGVAVTPDGQYLFVANSASGTLSVIQTNLIATTQDEVLTTINIGGELGGMTIDKDGDYVYVVSSSTDKVVKLDIADVDNIAKTTLTVGDNPQGVAVFRDGEKVFVTNADDDTVSVIEADDANVVNVGDSPAGIVASPYGDYVYVANEGDGTITVIDGDSLDVAATIAVGAGPYALCLASWGSYLYVANAGDGTLSIINALTLKVIDTVDVDSEPMGVSVPRNGSEAYVTDPADNTLSIVDLDGNVTVLDNAALNTQGVADLDGPMGLGNFLGGDAPDEPTGLAISNLGEESFTIKWADNAWDEKGYKVEIKDYSQDDPEFTLFAIVDPDVEKFHLTGLDDDTKYGVRIAAFSEAADSDFTAEVVTTTDESDDEEDDDDGSDCFINTLFQ